MLRHLRSRFRTGVSLWKELAPTGKGRQEEPKRMVAWQRHGHDHGHGFHTRSPCLCRAGGASSATVKPFILSDIGEGIKQVVIKHWHVKEGDQVDEFDDICDVESDKASATITSKYKGVVRKIHYEQDGVAQVGAPLVDIEVQAEAGEETGATKESRDVQVEAEAVERRTVGADTQVSGGGVDGVQVDGQSGSVIQNRIVEESGARERRTLATPAVRRMVRENQLSLQQILGSGKGGRVLKEDVLSFIENNKVNRRRDETESHYEQLKGTQAVTGAGAGAEAKHQDMVFRVEGSTRHMVRSMTASASIPTMTFGDEVNVTTLAQWREQFREALAKRGIKLTFLPFMMKAMSLAILKYPIVNATLDEKCEKITYKSAHNIGFAVATSRGLYVPNVKNVRNLSILQIALELDRLQSLAHAGTLAPANIAGGTITISNIGSVGGTYFGPMINPPEVVIGATGKLQILPRYNQNGDLVKSHIINISWAADHRIIDGATLANFSNTWKEYLENPAALLLGLV